jgi:hypothetical protein
VTQNPYQQYPPQPQGSPPGYDPQTGQAWPTPGVPAQQAPPAPPPWPAPQYAEPIQQPAPAGDEFATPDPPRSAAGESPALHQLKGRLLLIWPSKIAMAENYNKDGQEENVWFEAIVCDGPPIAEHVAGDTDVATPFAAGPKQAPFFIPMLQSKGAVLDRLRSTAPGGEQYGRPCLGRLVYRPAKGRGKPWPDIDQPTDQDRALARQILPLRAQLRAAAEPVRPPQPDSFAAPQGPPPGYGAPAGPPPGWAPQGPPPGQYPPF